MAFAENLKTARIENNFSQKALAEKVGIAQPTLAQYELGIKVPTLPVAIKIAKVLDTTCEKLVNDK